MGVFSDLKLSVATAWKGSNYGVFSGTNTEKYGPEKTPYLDTFNAVREFHISVVKQHVIFVKLLRLQVVGYQNRFTLSGLK